VEPTEQVNFKERDGKAVRHCGRASCLSPKQICTWLWEPNANRFALIFVGLLGGALACVATLNFFVNPLAIYPSQILPPVVQTTRTEKLELLDAYTEAPDGLILGSSRVMKIEPAYLQQKTGLSFFNAGVDYARPEDHLALAREYLRRFGHAPKMILLGVDVTAYSASAPVEVELVNTMRLADHVPEALTWRDRVERYENLLSWHQTKLSLMSIKHRLRASPESSPAESFQPDGLRIYHERESQIANGTYDLDAGIEYNQREYKAAFNGFQKHSGLRRQLFLELIKYCREHRTRLIVFIAPMHPSLESFLQTQTESTERSGEVVSFVSNLADLYQFPLIDLSSIDAFKGDPKQFVDGVHPLEPNTRRMIDVILETAEEEKFDAL
jgi:hypothetical protein